MPTPSGIDVALRQQMVTERVKASQLAKAQKLRADIEASLKDKFASIANKGTFANMTRGEFQSFLSGIVKDTSGILTEYKGDALDFLEDLTGAQRELAINVYEKLSGKTLAGDAVPDAASLWAKLSSREMAANGLSMEQTLQSGSDYTMGLIVRRLRQGQADGEPIQETLRSILGDDALGNRDGMLNKLEAAYRAGSNTNVQNVVTNTNSAVAGKLYDYYQWVSTLDDKTTVICQSRNGNVYKYGDGPMPPAHWNCRSCTIPATSDTATASAPENMAEWLKTQPASVVKYISNPKPLALGKLPGAARYITQGGGKVLPLADVAAAEPEPFKSTAADFAGLLTNMNEDSDFAAEERAGWDAMIGMPPRELFDSLMQDVPSYVDRDKSYKTFSPSSISDTEANYTFKMLDKDYGQVGFVSRTVQTIDGVRVGVGETLDINEKYQSGGLAKTLLKNQVAEWRDMGVTRVRIHAGLDVGGYAWARYGYVPTDDSWKQLARNMASRLADMKDVPADDRTYLTKLFTSDDPKSIWPASDSVYGKRLLLGSNWYGNLDLTDAASMARFNAYVG